MSTILIFGPKKLDNIDVIIEALKSHNITINEKTEVLVTGDSDFSQLISSHFSFSKIKTFKPDWKNIKREGAVVKTGAYGKYNSKAIFHRDEDMLKYLSDKGGQLFIIEQPGETDQLKKMAISRDITPVLFDIYKSNSKEVLYRL